MRGGQPRYLGVAIATALTLRAVVRLARHQAEGLIGSTIALLGTALLDLDLAVPDHSPLSRRAETLHVPRPRPHHGGALMHLLVDRTDTDAVQGRREAAGDARDQDAPSTPAETAPTQRDRHLRAIGEQDRMGWQAASGCTWRALVWADASRFKQVIGGALRSRTDRRRATEVAIATGALNRRLDLRRPEHVRTA